VHGEHAKQQRQRARCTNDRSAPVEHPAPLIHCTCVCVCRVLVEGMLVSCFSMVLFLDQILNRRLGCVFGCISCSVSTLRGDDRRRTGSQARKNDTSPQPHATPSE
jgi:hypothetical protein